MSPQRRTRKAPCFIFLIESVRSGFCSRSTVFTKFGSHFLPVVLIVTLIILSLPIVLSSLLTSFVSPRPSRRPLFHLSTNPPPPHPHCPLCVFSLRLRPLAAAAGGGMTARRATATGGTNTRRARGARRARRPARTLAATKRTRKPWSRRPHLHPLHPLLLFFCLVFLTLVARFPLPAASCLADEFEKQSGLCAPSLTPLPFC